MRPPPEFRVIEVRLDSFVPTAEAQSHPLGGVPSPLTLQAPRPMLLARCQDERLYLYRLQAQATTDGSGSASGLCLRRQPLDWLRCAPLTSSVKCTRRPAAAASGRPCACTLALCMRGVSGGPRSLRMCGWVCTRGVAPCSPARRTLNAFSERDRCECLFDRVGV